MGLVRHLRLTFVRRIAQYVMCLSMALLTASCASRQLPLNLVEDLNNDGIAWRDEAAGGNFDRPHAPEGAGAGAYPAELLPRAGERISSPEWDTEFVFPGRQRGAFNNFTCEWQRYKVPPGQYRSLAVLGASDGPGEKATLAFYYEGSRDERELAFPSWLDQEPAGGAVAALRFPYRYDTRTERTKTIDEPCTLWRVSFNLDPTKTLRSVVVRSYNSRVHVFAATLLCEDWTEDHDTYVREVERSYKQLREPVGSRFQRYQKQALQLRAKLDALPSAVRQRLERQVRWVRSEVEFARSVLPKDRVQLSAKEADTIEEWLDRAAGDVRALRRGRDPYAGRTGLVLKSYFDYLDATVQPYWLIVPEGYTSQRAWPLVVALHGHGWYKPFQGAEAEAIDGAIVLSPHGRGSIDYMLQSEADVLRCIDEVRRDYQIDPDRVTLTGRSMGGTGTWNLGVKFADRFAALAPIAGNTDSRVWEKLWKWAPPDDGPPLGKIKARVAYACDPVTWAPNLLNLPVFCIHGSDDRVVPVEHSRSMAMHVWQAPGTYYFDYREPQGVSHGAISKDLLDEQTAWLRGQKRAQRPERVHLEASKLRYGRAYWLKLEAMADPVAYARIRAEAHEDGKITITTKNVDALAIDLSASPAHGASDLSVAVDDAAAYDGPAPPEGTLSLLRNADGAWAAGAPRPGLAKRAHLEGPIEDAFLDPFVLVYGTGGPSAFDALVAKAEADRLAADWERLFGKPCRVKADTELADADVEQFNLVLYGGPQSNSVTARVMDKLPIRVERGAVHVGDKTFRGDDVGVKFCYPNPLNEKRYVVVFAGTTWRGLYQIVNRFGNWFHWGPFDNRNWFDYGVFDDRTHSPETFLCFGFFDPRWQLDGRYQWEGVERARAKASPRRLPQFATVDALPATASGVRASTRRRLYLSDLAPSLIDQHKGVVNSDMSFEGNALRVGQAIHAKGLGVRAPSEVVFMLDGKFDRFEAEVGVDMEGEETLTPVRKKTEWIQFEILADGKRVYRTDWLQGDDAGRRLSAPIEGARELRLRVNGSWARWLLGSAAWGSARVIGPGW